MTLMVLKAAVTSIAGNDVTGNCSKMEIAAEVEEKDVTTYASGGWQEVLGGITKGSVGLTLKNDLAAGQLDSIMWPLLGQVVTWTARASSAAVGTSNPQYSGNMLVKGWTPISGSPGDVNESSYTYPTSGVVSRATS